MTNLNLQHWRLDATPKASPGPFSTRPANRPTRCRGQSWTNLGRCSTNSRRKPPKALIFRSGKERRFHRRRRHRGIHLNSTAPEKARDTGRARLERCTTVWPPCAIRRWRWCAATASAAALELALACRYRIAVDEPGTKMGAARSHARHLPRLGRHAAPAAASSARRPRWT